MRTASPGERSESTERVVVHRPFRSRVVVESGGEVVSERVSRFAVLAVATERDVQVLVTPPSLGSGDVRPDAVVDHAVAEGLAEWREVREVAGRRCRVLRVGSSASDGTLVPYDPERAEHADVCIDEQGLVLEEWWVHDTDSVRHRVAIEVSTDVADRFHLEGEGSKRNGRVEPSDGEPRVTIEVPPSFDRVGRFDVVTAELGEAPSRSIVAEVWTRGPDLLVLEHGVGEVAPHPHATSIDLGGGTADLIVDLRSTEIRFQLGELSVRLYGTLGPDDLAGIAATLAVAG